MKSSLDETGAPDSWETDDLEESITKLILSTSSKDDTSASPKSECGHVRDGSAGFGLKGGYGVAVAVAVAVDQFLIEAIHNPRERVSVLRIEQDVEKFIRDPMRQQMEFKQLPTSYLRLAAHRVAQHYSLQSMVMLDNNLPDGSGSRIIISKTADSRIPSIRLVDIPVNLPSESKGVTKVAIKQRPQKHSTSGGGANSHANKSNSGKSVEERKEEYNRARARIFSSSSFSSGTGGRLDSEPRVFDSYRQNSLGRVKLHEKTATDGTDINIGRVLRDSSASSSRVASSRLENEPVARFGTNNRAIFRDHEVERSDPDYDRTYDRYMQRFDPGFGFTGGHYAVQPIYAPAVNYSTEFPQVGLAPRLSMHSEHQPQTLPQHLPGSWVLPSTPTGIGYGHPDAMMAAYSTTLVGGRPSSALYMHSAQYHSQHPGMPIYSHDQIQSFTQAHRQQHDARFGFVQPR